MQGPLALILCLALAAGVAWALQSQTVAAPAGNGAFTTLAQIVPGSQGEGVVTGHKRGTKTRPWEIDDVDYSVGFDGSSGLIVINGQSFGSFDPGHHYSVQVLCHSVGGLWYAESTVSDDDTQTVVATQSGHQIAARPEEVTAEGAEVISLTVQ